MVADDYVSKEFGTGARKMPGHDPHDCEIGQRHHLELINIANKDATLNKMPQVCRDGTLRCARLFGDMGAADLVLKEEPYLMNVPFTTWW